VFPSAARKVSSQFWTPVTVALRAARLLVEEGARRVLDVGSGVGKFCIVGAASTGATFVGVEHRDHFVAVARDAARRIGAPTAHFIHGTLDAVDVADFDAFYFFNPFAENLQGPDVQLDQTVPLSEPRFLTDVERALRMLVQARVGTRVVTYHGLGDDLPPGYVLAHKELRRSGCLNLWIKTTSATRRRFRGGPSNGPLNLAG
jgi:SAM-dependent methyltransferase